MKFFRNPEVQKTLIVYVAVAVVATLSAAFMDMALGAYVLGLCAVFTVIYLVSAYRRCERISELSYILEPSKSSPYYNKLYMQASILAMLIMLASISLIYNAFSISVFERTKEFGLLASVGATKMQLCNMVFFESFVLGAVGIPIGILTGIGGMGIIIAAIGDKFKSADIYLTWRCLFQSLP